VENISIGLKWVIGVIVTILIIAAAISIYLVINGYFGRAQEQTLSQSQLITQAEFSNYDNKDVSGQDVINAATRYSGRPQFSILISTGENRGEFYAENNHSICYVNPGTGKKLDISTASCAYGKQQPVSAMQDQKNSRYYVNTSAVFASTIFKDNNGEVRLIYFYQK